MITQRGPLVLFSLVFIFSIFRIDAQTTLPIGVPTSDNVDAGVCTQYVLDISTISPPLTSTDVVSIVASPFFGDPDLYVSQLSNPGPAQSSWSATTGAGDAISISATDPNWPTQGKFYICVYGATIQGVVSFTSSFSLTAWIPTRISPFGPNAPGIIHLSTGVPQVASVAAHSWAYFSFNVTTPGQTPEIPIGNFTISVTPISASGDPDVYVKWEGQPSQSAWDYLSTNYGADYIKVRPDTANFKTYGTYYIAVYGWLPCTFSVSAFSDSLPATLLDGVPLVQEADQFSFAQFGYFLGGNLELTSSVTPISANGDPDLYMALTQPVSSTNYIWRSMHVGGDTITVPITDANHQFPQFYFMGVYGYWADTVFSIVAYSSASAQLLQGGVPTIGNVSKTTQTGPTAVFYKFTVGDISADINIQITPQQGGSPYFYVAKPSSQVYQPSAAPGKFDYACTSNMGCSLTIPSSQLEKGNYFVGVYWGYSFSATINYYLQMSSNYTTVSLMVGTPVLGNVPQGYYRYYSFSITQPQDITIAVGSLSGDPDLYISTNVQHPNASAGGFTWRSFHVGSESLNILQTDANFEIGTYYIAVYGYRESVFSIVAYTSGSTVALTNAIPISGFVHRGTYVYYSFAINNPNAKLTLSLAVTSANGDADMYVSVPSSGNAKPNMYAFDYRSTSFGGDSIVETDQMAGVYFIGVYGYTDNVTYIITAFEEDALIPDNMFINDVVTEVTNNYYGVMIPDDIPSGQVSITVTVFSGNTNLYLWFGDFTAPTLSSSNRSCLSWPGNSLTIQTTDPDFVYGKWTLAVESADQNPVSRYQISVTTNIAQLSPGVPHFSEVTSGFTQTFQISVGTQQQQQLEHRLISDISSPDQLISVKMYGGQVAIYASQYETTPNATNFVAGRDYMDTATGDHFLTIPGSSINPSQPLLYISVVGAIDSPDGSGAKYNIITYSSAVRVTLSNDQPIYSKIDNGQTSQFIANVPPSSPIFTARLTSCNNNAAATFSVNASGSIHPGSSQGSGFRQGLEILNPVSDQLYMVDVTGGMDNSQFLLYASTTQGNIRPAPGNNGKFQISISSPYTLSFSWQPAQTISPPVQYRIYATVATLANENGLQVVNMDTPCSLESNPSIQQLIDWTTFTPGTDGTIRLTLNVQNLGFSNGLYGINIAVQNNLGLREAYVPIVINPAAKTSHTGLSGGSIFLIVFFVLLFAYFSAGFAYNMSKGARGMEACPNIEFWRSIPALCTDGCIFCFVSLRNCCSRGGYRGYQRPGYSEVPDASINVDSFGAPPPPRYTINAPVRAELGDYGAM